MHSDAGEDQIQLLADGLVTLDGSGSADALGHTITYSWTIPTVPDGSTITTTSLSDDAVVNPTFTPDTVGDYILQLVIGDGIITDTNTLTISVN